MKNLFALSFTTLFLAVTGCQMDQSPDPEIIIEPPISTLIAHDTITTGNYLGMSIGDEAESIYSVVQFLQQTSGVTAINIVSNISSDITKLRDRIALYDYILLDQNTGTDTGVQITLEKNKVKAIYLNSGKKLSQWPEKGKPEASVRMGDEAGALYGKLFNISKDKSHSNKFQRISLLTKNLNSPFDPEMARSPQWYFAHKTGPGLWEVVMAHFKEGRLNAVEVQRYRD
ncbi:hypothetical protein [Dyadobacter bucti]|uniref:hypothetical protein n=1 Tax=Dyadobacter bucti TaxID=2572203 RepID=UPI003F71405E